MKKINPVLAHLLPRSRDFIFAGILFFLVVFGGPKLFNNDGDLGRHIAIGNYILAEGVIPTSDIFSHTMYGQRLVPHEWLAQIAFALAHRAMGLSGDVYIAALLAAVPILLVYDELIKRGVMRLAAFLVTMWAGIVASVHWLARPHMFTFLFVTLWVYWLEGVFSGRLKNIWRFPLLMLIWANTHGAFIAGFVVWGVYLADWLWEFWQGRGEKETGKRLAFIGIVSLLVTFINPSGWHLWGTSVGYIGNDYLTSHTVEYLSPNFHIKYLWPFMFMIAFGLFSLAQDYRIHLRDGLLLAGWTMLALYSVRNLPLFAVITAPIFGTMIHAWAQKLPVLDSLNSRFSETEELLRGNLWVYVIALVLGLLLWRGTPLDEKGTGNVYLPDKMPVQAVDWLFENKQEGNMFNNFIWGGYILYRMWPSERVFIDGQTDFYGEDLLREYLDTMYVKEGWEATLDKYKVSWIIARMDDPLSKELRRVEDDAWYVIYEDDIAVIFRRDIARP